MASTATSSRFTPAPTPPPGGVATINDNSRSRPQSRSGSTTTVAGVATTTTATTAAARARKLVKASNPKLPSARTTPLPRSKSHQVAGTSHSSPCPPHHSTITPTSTHSAAASATRNKMMLRKTSSFSQDDATRNNSRPKLLAQKSSKSVLSAPISSSMKTAHLRSSNSDDHSLFSATRLRNSATAPPTQNNFFHVNDLRTSKLTSTAQLDDPLRNDGDVGDDDIDSQLHRPSHYHSSSGFVYARGEPVVDPFRNGIGGSSPAPSPPHSYSPSSSLSSGSSSPYATNPRPEELLSHTLSTPSPLSSAGSDKTALTEEEFASDHYHNRHVLNHHHTTIPTQQGEESHTHIDNNNHHRQVVVSKETDEVQDARTNRKVLDLQISNASLVSLNKTLERSLHRQRNELRRLKTYFKTCSSTLAFPDDETIEKILSSKLSDENDEEAEGQGDDGDGHSDYDGRLHGESERTGGDKDAQKQLQKDLELFKVQRDTIDQIDGAINRCMFITESLVGEGKNALEYKVSPADCKLGGRVLLADDDDEDEEEEEQDGDN